MTSPFLNGLRMELARVDGFLWCLTNTCMVRNETALEQGRGGIAADGKSLYNDGALIVR